MVYMYNCYVTLYVNVNGFSVFIVVLIAFDCGPDYDVHSTFLAFLLLISAFCESLLSITLYKVFIIC